MTNPLGDAAICKLSISMYVSSLQQVMSYVSYSPFHRYLVSADNPQLSIFNRESLVHFPPVDLVLWKYHARRLCICLLTPPESSCKHGDTHTYVPAECLSHFQQYIVQEGQFGHGIQNHTFRVDVMVCPVTHDPECLSSPTSNSLCGRRLWTSRCI